MTRIGALVISRGDKVLHSTAVPPGAQLIATVEGLSFHFQPPQYPLPPQPKRDIHAMTVEEILDHLKEVWEEEKEYDFPDG